MLMIAKLSVVSGQAPFCSFAEWLKFNRPSYFNRIGKLAEHMIVELRNREHHAKMLLITKADAEKMFDASKEVLSLIHEDRAQQI
jgi:hypothetical protein